MFKKQSFIFLIFFILGHQVFAQLKFVERNEMVSELGDPLFEIINSESGLVSFRIVPEKGLNLKTKLQYFIADSSLHSAQGLIEYPVKEGFDMVDYDIDKDQLFVLFTKGYTYKEYPLNSSKYVLQINLSTNKQLEFEVDNILNMALSEFLVQNQKAIFIGNSENKPVLQIHDLLNKSIYTLQGISGIDTQILQARKIPKLQLLEVVFSKKGTNRNRDLNINTYDMTGEVVRDLRVEEFGEPGQEIIDEILLSNGEYKEVMIGGFGLGRKKNFQGMYLMDINEFGEFDFKLYSLDDFPNFYNYLNRKEREKREASFQKDLEKNKIPSISSTNVIRDVLQSTTDYYIYFDQYVKFSNRRSSYNDGTTSGSSSATEYRFLSAHFAKIAKEGNVIWDNSNSYDELITSYPKTSGAIAAVGDEFYHMYLQGEFIKLNFLKNGEKIFENQEFELGLINENERISNTNLASLRLVHWYDRYYLLSGKQRIRFLNEAGTVQLREVYFLTKIAVDGDLYTPEELPD